jgi:hypothetical protein
MNSRFRSYTGYSVGLGVVWAVLLVLASQLASSGKFHNILMVFAGFAIAWVSGTIARFVYPPPKKWLGDADSGS